MCRCWRRRAGLARAAAPVQAPAKTQAPALLGITYAGWKGDYRTAPKRLETIKAIGFQIVSFVPTYAYVGLDKIDFRPGPTPPSWARRSRPRCAPVSAS